MMIKNIIIIKLGRIEIDYRLTHIVLGRVTKFNHIGLIDNISKNRLYKVIPCYFKMEGRINKENDFKYCVGIL